MTSVEPRDMITRQSVSFITSIFHCEPHPDCEYKTIDAEALEAIRNCVLAYPEVGSCSILRSWDEFINDAAEEESLCGLYKLDFFAQHAEERTALWEKLSTGLVWPESGWLGIAGNGRETFGRYAIMLTSPLTIV